MRVQPRSRARCCCTAAVVVQLCPALRANMLPTNPRPSIIIIITIIPSPAAAALQVLHELQMGGADEEAAAEAALGRLAEKDGQFVANPSTVRPIRSSASGHVRQVRGAAAGTYWHGVVQLTCADERRGRKQVWQGLCCLAKAGQRRQRLPVG